MKKIGLSALLTSLALLSGCATMTGKNAPATAAEKESQAEGKLCKKMIDSKDAVREYPQINGDTPLALVKEANDKVAEAIQEVQKSGKEVTDPGVLEVQSSYQELQNAVNEIPGGRSTVGESWESVSESARQLQTAWEQLYTSLECGA